MTVSIAMSREIKDSCQGISTWKKEKKPLEKGKIARKKEKVLEWFRRVSKGLKRQKKIKSSFKRLNVLGSKIDKKKILKILK